jgi:2-oxoglutarate dehydrogenase E2 component (dihydrolipoamide succinyltransferase)
MSITIEVPALGESITEAIIARWLKQVGEPVAADEPIVELETDKITVEVPAPHAGVITKQLAEEGDTVNVGDPVASFEAGEASVNSEAAAEQDAGSADIPAGPTARAEARRLGVDLQEVEGTGRKGRVQREDVVRAASDSDAPTTSPSPASVAAPSQAGAATGGAEGPVETRVRMTTLRKRIAARLVEAQSTAAILTTFNEVDMTAVMAMRSEYKQRFLDKHGVKLGFMSFFVKAAVEALKAFPSVNAEIQGEEIVYKQRYDIGVAVGGGKGLVVPVIRGADRLGFAAIEKDIGRLAGLARSNKLQISDLTGGTFTISNGGIYGSMLSTPILNHPQTGILGLHNIVERPVAVNGAVEIRPIMYLALSYDHRLIDGREAVQFLIRVKEAIEDPRRLLIEV